MRRDETRDPGVAGVWRHMRAWPELPPFRIVSQNYWYLPVHTVLILDETDPDHGTKCPGELDHTVSFCSL